ncbi:MAG: hypothetical protein ASARMPRED_001269 [Alectoria sarmentosa]|nr:MAG: hypothetical protein ASARMPRED_001269 [Alectoria sarmentosa]
MEHPSKRRRIERNSGGPAEGLNVNNGRERSVSLGGSTKNEKPIMPKLVLPPHGAPGHPAHGDQALDASGQSVDRPHYPLESADTKPARVHARQIVQTSAIIDPTAPKTSDAMAHPSGTPTSKADDNSYPGQVVPPAGVAAADARNQALQSQQAQAVAVKQLDAIPQAPAPAPATHAAASASPKALNAPDSSSQQIVKAPSTPPPSNQSPTAMSSTSYFSASPTSSPSPSPQHTSSPSAPSPTFTPNKPEFATNYNGTVSAFTTTSSNPSSLNSESSSIFPSLLALTTASQSSLASISALMTSISDARNPSASLQNLASSTSSQQITSTPTTLSTSVSTTASSQFSSQASIASVMSSASAAGAGGNGNSGNTAPTPTASSSSNGDSGGSGAPPTQDLVGGIVGGVAGLAMIFVILLLLLRWRRGKLGNRRTISPPVPQTIGYGGVPQSGNMTQRSSTAPIVAAGFFRSLRPASSQTATTAETAPSERGFQKISGRKLPSVLASGGDGWGDPPATGPTAGPSGAAAGLGMAAGVAKGRSPFDDPPPGQRPSPPHSLSGSSFYRDSHGFYGGVVPEEQTEASSSPGSSSSPTYFAPLGAAAGRSNVPLGHGSPTRRNEAAQMRPGPARTPVINQPGFGSIRGGAPPRPIRATPPPAGLNPARDGLGRSHPSQDGSRGSRFREDTTPP